MFVVFLGQYCEFAVSDMTECRQGTYMPNGATPGSGTLKSAGTGSLTGGE